MLTLDDRSPLDGLIPRVEDNCPSFLRCIFYAESSHDAGVSELLMKFDPEFQEPRDLPPDLVDLIITSITIRFV